ncbi:MAG: translocase, partial [Planctomycetaceae bacterium]|nr:translocase [Planctomycetaceae bacterium]
MLGLNHVYHWTKSGFIPSVARRSRWRSKARSIVRRSQQLNSLTDEELKVAGRKLRWEARTGTTLEKLLPEAFALVRQSARRVLNMEHFEVQIMGAIAVFEGHIAEMQTGEGKTLT